MPDPIYQKIYKIIAQIPKGKIAIYGQIAKLAGIPGRPRRVGYALRILPDDIDIPWHRVINAKGEISPRGEMGFAELQQNLLKKESIQFDSNGKISLVRFQWQPQLPVRKTTIDHLVSL